MGQLGHNQGPPLEPQATIRVSPDGKYAVVLCHIGHFLESHKLGREFAGSRFEADWGARTYRKEPDRFDRMAARCQGAGHEHL